MLRIYLGIFFTGLLVVGLYLYFSYAYIYNFQDRYVYDNPSHLQKFEIGDRSSSTITYIALGDSLTAGVGVDEYQKSVSFLIAQNLAGKKNSHVTFYNFAHPGDNSEEVLKNQIPQMFKVTPDIITLFIGINDVHNKITQTDFKKNYQQIIEELKKTNSEIILINIPYLGSKDLIKFPYDLLLDLRTKQFNHIIQKLAEKENLKVVDLYTRSKNELDESYYNQDKFHLNEQGYKKWGELINADINY